MDIAGIVPTVEHVRPNNRLIEGALELDVRFTLYGCHLDSARSAAYSFLNWLREVDGKYGRFGATDARVTRARLIEGKAIER